MSAKELRQAAETLRDLCARADEGHDPESEDRWFRVLDGMTVTTWARFAATHENEAPYIATMHPGVGLALSDLLDAQAEHVASRDCEAHCAYPDGGPRCRAALALARLINGSAS